MKFEVKVLILSLLFSIVCMIGFTYVCSFSQKTMYAYQVGIYKEAENKDAKVKELKELGFQSYVYQKDEQYYVLSLITDSYKDVSKHASQVKGIIKQYEVSSDTTIDILLDNLEKGVTHD